MVPEPFDASGCFETIRVERSRGVNLKEHLRRLRASLQTVGIGFPAERALLSRINAEAGRIKEGYVRMAVRRSGEMVVQSGRNHRYSAAQARKGISLVTAAARWPAGEIGLAQVKHSERLAGILARAEARAMPEVLRLGAHGYLTEGTVSNLFFVKEGTLFTPPVWSGVLDGITRRAVLAAAKRLQVPVREVPVTRHELFNAEEAFLTNVLMDLLPVREVDGRRIGDKIPGPITRRLKKEVKRG